MFTRLITCSGKSAKLGAGPTTQGYSPQHPHSDANQSPPSSTDGEEHEDWKVSFGAFQEWLGLACMTFQLTCEFLSSVGK